MAGQPKAMYQRLKELEARAWEINSAVDMAYPCSLQPTSDINTVWAMASDDSLRAAFALADLCEYYKQRFSI